MRADDPGSKGNYGRCRNRKRCGHRLIEPVYITLSLLCGDQTDLSVITAIVFSGVKGRPSETSCKYNLVPSQTPRGPIFWENLSPNT